MSPFFFRICFPIRLHSMRICKRWGEGPLAKSNSPFSTTDHVLVRIFITPHFAEIVG